MDDRRAKLERLREQGVDPFSHQFEGVVATSEIVDDLAKTFNAPRERIATDVSAMLSGLVDKRLIEI